MVGPVTRPGPRGAERLILQALGGRGPSTRADLAASTRLPISTVIGATGRLLTRGLIRPRADQQRTGPVTGRPAVTLELVEPDRLTAVVVLHHRDMRAAFVDQNGSILAEARQDGSFWRKPHQHDIARACLALLDHARQGLAGGQVEDQIVVGLPVPYRQGIGRLPMQLDEKPHHAWMRTDLAAVIRQRTGIPAYVENSCRLTTLAEQAFGSARGCRNLIYLQLVGGSNSGIIADGNLLRGSLGGAGEISHLHVSPDGPMCSCGARGCLGVVIENSDSIIRGLRPKYSDVRDIYDVLGLAAQGAPGLQRHLRHLGRTYGQSLAAGCVMLNPELIVIDGSLGPAAAPIIAGIRDSLQRLLPETLYRNLDLVSGRFGPEGAMKGAATLANSLAAL